MLRGGRRSWTNRFKTKKLMEKNEAKNLKCKIQVYRVSSKATKLFLKEIKATSINVRVLSIKQTNKQTNKTNLCVYVCSVSGVLLLGFYSPKQTNKQTNICACFYVSVCRLTYLADVQNQSVSGEVAPPYPLDLSSMAQTDLSRCRRGHRHIDIWGRTDPASLEILILCI